MKAIVCGVIVLGTMFLPRWAKGTDYTANPGDTLDVIINGMQPGDTLTLNAGTYPNADEHIENVNGTESAPITIQAFTGAAVVITGDYAHNAIDFYNCSYITLKDVEIRTASNAIKLNSLGLSHHITLENLILHDTDGVAISGPGPGNHHITIRGCEIYDTGINNTTTGEAIYLGYWDNPVDYLTIENCYIHDLHGTQTDGLELKYARAAIIRNNVIQGNTEPCIKCESSGSGSMINIIEGNVCYGSNDSGIEVYGEAYVTNNIVFDCDIGLYSRDDLKYVLENVRFINNTVYNCSTACIQLNGWSDKANLVIANNALYQTSSSQQAIYIGPDAPLHEVLVSSNYYYGTYYNNNAPDTGWIPASSPDTDMVDPVGHDFWPRSGGSLVDAGDNSIAPDYDFNAVLRPYNSVVDAGAYEWRQASNPGWTIAAAFNPTVTPVTPPPVSGGGGSSGCSSNSRRDIPPASGAALFLMLVLLIAGRREPVSR